MRTRASVDDLRVTLHGDWLSQGQAVHIDWQRTELAIDLRRQNLTILRCEISKRSSPISNALLVQLLGVLKLGPVIFQQNCERQIAPFCFLRDAHHNATWHVNYRFN